MSLIQQQELLQAIDAELRPQVPPQAREVLVKYSKIGRFGTLDGIALYNDSPSEKFLPSGRLMFTTAKLRHSMATACTGTWFIATFRITPGAPMTVSFDYDSKPELPEEPDRRTYEDEQQSYPRSEENMPDWFKKGLGLEV